MIKYFILLHFVVAVTYFFMDTCIMFKLSKNSRENRRLCINYIYKLVIMQTHTLRGGGQSIDGRLQ